MRPSATHGGIIGLLGLVLYPGDYTFWPMVNLWNRDFATVWVVVRGAIFVFCWLWLKGRRSVVIAQSN